MNDAPSSGPEVVIADDETQDEAMLAAAAMVTAIRAIMDRVYGPARLAMAKPAVKNAMVIDQSLQIMFSHLAQQNPGVDNDANLMHGIGLSVGVILGQFPPLARSYLVAQLTKGLQTGASL